MYFKVWFKRGIAELTLKSSVYHAQYFGLFVSGFAKYYNFIDASRYTHSNDNYFKDYFLSFVIENVISEITHYNEY